MRITPINQQMNTNRTSQNASGNRSNNVNKIQNPSFGTTVEPKTLARIVRWLKQSPREFVLRHATDLNQRIARLASDEHPDDVISLDKFQHGFHTEADFDADPPVPGHMYYSQPAFTPALRIKSEEVGEQYIKLSQPGQHIGATERPMMYSYSEGDAIINRLNIRDEHGHQIEDANSYLHQLPWSDPNAEDFVVQYDRASFGQFLDSLTPENIKRLRENEISEVKARRAEDGRRQRVADAEQVQADGALSALEALLPKVE